MTAAPPPPPNSPPPSNSPPPPPPLRNNEAEVSVPAIAGLVPLAALLAVIGVFTPWFKPQVSATVDGVQRSGDAVEDALYSFKEGRLGLVAPVVLVIVAIGVVALLRGRTTRYHRGSKSPVVNAARASLIGGAVAIVSVIVAYLLLPSQYKLLIDGREYSWDGALDLLRRNGASDAELSQGPQLGFWFTLAGGIVAILAGVLMLVLHKKAAPAADVPRPGAPTPTWQPTPPPPPPYSQGPSQGPPGPGLPPQ